MEKAAFRLDYYRFTKACINFDIPDSVELNITLKPRGRFYERDAQYNLEFDVVVDCKETGTTVVEVSCEALFSFGGKISIQEIPDYFYPNSLAILFPYIRAFVSTITLQSNVRPIVLPTINLMGLTEELKEQTSVSE